MHAKLIDKKTASYKMVLERIRIYIRESFMLNFILSVMTHQYFLLVVLALTYT